MAVHYNWYELLYSIFIYSALIPISLGVSRWKLLTRPERWVIGFLGAILLDELLSLLCIALHTRNHFLFHIQTVTVLITGAGVYADTIGRHRLVWRIAIGVSILMLLEVFAWVGFNHINSATLTISRLLLAVYAAITLNRLLAAKPVYSLSSYSMVYVHLGFFIFGAFAAINACFMNYFIETSTDLFFLFQNISALTMAIAFALFSIGFLRVKSRTANTIFVR